MRLTRRGFDIAFLIVAMLITGVAFIVMQKLSGGAHSDASMRLFEFLFWVGAYGVVMFGYRLIRKRNG